MTRRMLATNMHNADKLPLTGTVKIEAIFTRGIFSPSCFQRIQVDSEAVTVKNVVPKEDKRRQSSKIQAVAILMILL